MAWCTKKKKKVTRVLWLGALLASCLLHFTVFEDGVLRAAAGSAARALVLALRRRRRCPARGNGIRAPTRLHQRSAPDTAGAPRPQRLLRAAMCKASSIAQYPRALTPCHFSDARCGGLTRFLRLRSCSSTGGWRGRRARSASPGYPRPRR